MPIRSKKITVINIVKNSCCQIVGHIFTYLNREICFEIVTISAHCLLSFLFSF